MSPGRVVASRTEHSPMVAVVEDDAAARRALSRMLRAHGLRISSFSSAEELLQAYPHLRPSCLVLDVVLPGMSGPDLVERLSAGARIPRVVFVSGHIDAPAMLKRRGLGDFPCLQKPFEPALLIQAVSRLLGEPRKNHA